MTPKTIKDVDLPGRIEKATGSRNLKETGDFFGWRPRHITKDVGEFTKEELLAKGWSKESLLDIAQAYDDIKGITPDNPSAEGRAKQLRELAAKFFD
jgi:hypothetical protein